MICAVCKNPDESIYINKLTDFFYQNIPMELVSGRKKYTFCSYLP